MGGVLDLPTRERDFNHDAFSDYLGSFEQIFQPLLVSVSSFIKLAESFVDGQMTVDKKRTFLNFNF